MFISISAIIILYGIIMVNFILEDGRIIKVKDKNKVLESNTFLKVSISIIIEYIY